MEPEASGKRSCGQSQMAKGAVVQDNSWDSAGMRESMDPDTGGKRSWCQSQVADSGTLDCCLLICYILV